MKTIRLKGTKTSYIELLACAYWSAPADSKEEELLERALKLACKREGVEIGDGFDCDLLLDPMREVG